MIKSKPVTSLEKYGQWDREDLKGNLDVFPKQIYLKCQFDEENIKYNMYAYELEEMNGIITKNNCP